MVFFSIIFSLFFFGTLNSTKANDISTSVNVLPNLKNELQIKGESYFNYDVTGMDGQSLKSSMDVLNLKDEKIKVKLSVSNGLTNLSDVSYESAKKNEHSGFLNKKYIMENIITDLPEIITLEPNETKRVDFNINVPKKLKGQYVGLIRFEYIDEDKKKDGDSTIEFKVAYSIGLWIKGEDIKINEAEVVDVKLDERSKKPIILAKFLNENPHFLKNQKVEYEVFKIGEGKNKENAIFKDKKKQPIISPKNYFWYPIKWDGKVSPGKYKIEINGKEFFFEIKKDDIPEEEDENTIIVENSGIPFWVWILIALLLGIILFLLFKKRKKDGKESDEIKDERVSKDSLSKKSLEDFIEKESNENEGVGTSEEENSRITKVENK